MSKALAATALKRGTSKILEETDTILDEIECNQTLEKMWRMYQKKFSYGSDIEWQVAIQAVKDLWEKIKL